MKKNTTADWSVLELPGVEDKALIAARKVAGSRELPPHLSVRDLEQDALILIATNPDLVRGYVADEQLGHLYVWVKHRLVNDLDALRTKRRCPEGGTISFDALCEERLTAAPAVGSGETYTTELVEHLLVAVVDPLCAYGLTSRVTPDPTMPRAQTDPSMGCTLFAHLADIRRAWNGALLPIEPKRALFCRHVLSLSRDEAALVLGCSARTVDRRVERGLAFLARHLNGGADPRTTIREASQDLVTKVTPAA